MAKKKRPAEPPAPASSGKADGRTETRSGKAPPRRSAQAERATSAANDRVVTVSGRAAGVGVLALVVIAAGVVAVALLHGQRTQSAAAPPATQDTGAAGSSQGTASGARGAWPPAWDALPVAAAAPGDTRTEGSRRMAALLALASTALDPDNAYLAGPRMAQLRAATPPSDPAANLQYQLTLAETELEAGEFEAAALHYVDIKTALEAGGQRLPHSDLLHQVTSILAATWLRLGETENCVANHNADSCRLPIAGGGLHTLPRGSTNALELLEELLTAYPDDLESRWLLNLAAQTLGQYPDGVPERWRLPPELFSNAESFPRFRDIAPELGVDRQGLAGGALMDDFTGDGLLDVLASSSGADAPLVLYASRGDGTFEERTAPGVEGITGGLNMVHGDYDNDGDLDVFVLRGGWWREAGRRPSSLLRNRGDGVFDDVTAEAGLLRFHPTQTGAWADYDGDGWLDLYIGNETFPGGPAHHNELYHNDGDGTFTNVASALGVDKVGPYKGVVWGDVDNDGRPDLYLSALGADNVLFHNDGPGADGEWRFSDITERAGVAKPVYSFPAWFFDYDNDGWLDLFVSGYTNPDHFLFGAAGDFLADQLGLPTNAERARLYHNNGDGTFADASAAAGVHKVIAAMGSNFGDFDTDGFLDMYLGTGEPDYRSLVPNRAFLNKGGSTFAEVTYPSGLAHIQKGHGVAFGDLDNDGDEDVYQVMGGAYQGDWYHAALYENPGFGHHWLTLRLEGRTENRAALGARIAVTVRDPATGEERAIHRVVTSGGTFGGSSLQQEIGLGDATEISALEVTWPASGVTQRFEGVAPDRAYTLTEGAPELTPLPAAPFRFQTGAAPHEHDG